jgi:serine protease Do
MFRSPVMLVLGVLALAPAAGEVSDAEARSHPAGRRGVPAMVARVYPAVVSITTRQIERDQFNQPVPTRGLGSGFIVDARGYIFTNNHVVEGAEQIKVTLPDERAFRARLVGADPLTDLAVLKIEGTNLPVVALGDSSKLSLGESVVAIGSPLWIEGGPTVTTGVVSGFGRSLEGPGLPSLHNLIQTDAAINPGNSGGPLLNLAGQVVGISTAVIASAHGIGFTIPINEAKPVLQTLLAGGRIVRPAIGLAAISLTPQLAFANDLPIDRGAVVMRVDPGGPAETAGMRPGDVITALDGGAVRDLHHFHDLLFRRKPGETVEVTLWREGQTVTVRPVLGVER